MVSAKRDNLATVAKDIFPCDAFYYVKSTSRIGPNCTIYLNVAFLNFFVRFFFSRNINLLWITKYL